MTPAHDHDRDPAPGASAMSSFLDPGLDFSTEGLSEDEAERYLAWCKRIHGEGNLDLVPFAQFFVEFDPKGLKRLRRHTGNLALPAPAAVLMWAHTYCVLGFEKGVIYEAIAARELGVSRQAFVEVLRVAGYLGGPLALNAAGEFTLDYLRRWGDEPGAAKWPATWAADPHGLEAGIDHRSDDLLDGELGSIQRWHTKVHGSPPRGLDRAAAANPGAFKLARIRFERMAGESIPVQLVPLLLLHTAVVSAPSSVRVREAAELAAFLGVDRRTIEDTVHWGAVVGGASTMFDAFEALGDGAGTTDR